MTRARLDGLPEEIRSRWPEWAAISLFATLLAFAIPRHEPWTDEAQAWQLARSLSLTDLFQNHIRYEATPGLWHFLLWALIRVHVSYIGLHWICAATAVGATSLLVLKSPFPRYLKLTLPFTYFLLFQYAVIARSYVLVPLLLFLAAFLWKRNPVQIALVLGLMANTSLHAAVISGGLALVYLIEQVRNRKVDNTRRRFPLLLFACILLAFYAFAIWTAWPPHDLPIAGFRGQSRPFIDSAVVSLVGGICQPWLLSIPFWIAMGLCLGARRSLFYLLPVLLFAAFSGAVYAQWWHVGLLIPLVICLLWITWPASGVKTSWQEMLIRGALVYIAGTQILWSAYALAYDRDHAYSPAAATADFLRPFVKRGATIAVTFLGAPPDDNDSDAIAILPYFDHNIFVNMPDSFWWWRRQNPTEQLFHSLLPSHPDIVLVEVRTKPGRSISLDNAKVSLLTNSGYRFTNEFCGTMPERMELGLTSCNLILRYSDESQSLSPNQSSHRIESNSIAK